jgi:hypothetical protein
MALNLKSRETNVSAHTGLIWKILCCLWAGGREKREGACIHMLLDSAPCSLQPPGCVSTQLVPEASFRRNSLVGGVETYKRGALDMRETLKNLEIIAEKIPQDSRETTNLTSGTWQDCPRTLRSNKLFIVLGSRLASTWLRFSLL